MKIGTSLCLLLLIAFASYAQNKLPTLKKSDTSFIEPGFRLGFNVSNLWGPAMRQEGGDMHFGAMGGGIAQVNLTDLFVLETGITASVKGSRYIKADPEYLEDEKWALDLFYLEIPVIAKLRFPSEGQVVPFMGIGPSFDIRFYSRKRKDIDNAIRQYSFNDTTNAFDIAATGVAGVHVMTGDRGHLIGEVRAMLGLLELRNDMIVRNWSGTVSIAYVFNLKRPKPLW